MKHLAQETELNPGHLHAAEHVDKGAGLEQLI